MSAERFVSWESTCRIQRVLQHDNSGCGVACLAMVANISYLAARGVFDAIGIPQIRPRNPYATNFKQLRQALTEFGVDSTLERWRGWQHFSGVGILAVNAGPGSSPRNWHWVVAETHPTYEVVVHDPSPSHAIMKQAPENFLRENFEDRCQPRQSWIRIHQYNDKKECS
ncbi:hypothetical protein IFT48_03560 [Pseudomonas fluorescens]|uniref:hypothetical protein n=1 Tax=Pseudomonas fluorescens TaxID=294 RepID=UPI001930ADDA|nr:hypothetical protein [Pseudomonas fluorescens]MBD8089046.1 hypothetical protein [Pseudomonas fluorescens]